MLEGFEGSTTTTRVQGPRADHLPPASVVLRRLWLLQAYIVPAVPGSMAMEETIPPSGPMAVQLFSPASARCGAPRQRSTDSTATAPAFHPRVFDAIDRMA